MTVYVVYNTDAGPGYIAAIFSSNKLAHAYVAQHPYSSFILSEHEVNAQCKVKADAKT